MSSADFDAAAFHRDFVILEQLPLSLYDDTVHAHDDLALSVRVRGVLGWYAALRDGRVPEFEEVAWPNRRVFDALAMTLRKLDLPRWTRKDPAITEDVVRQILTSAGRCHHHADRRLRELERAIRQQVNSAGRSAKRGVSEALIAQAVARARQDLAGTVGSNVVDSRLQKAVDESLQAANAADCGALDAAFTQTWAERIRVWQSIEDVIGELGSLTGIGWDLSNGVLTSVGWLEAAKLARLLEQLPQLREIIRTLGRMQDATRSDEPSVMEAVFEPVLRAAEELRDVRSPSVPHEMRGIERSDEISRMLPSEAVLLTDTGLEWLWHARRTERALAVYRVEGTEYERVAVNRVGDRPVQRAKPKPERGPILVCVDTSGSMSGLPETIAKAIALEAARTAHREKRRCLLYAFGGPGEVIEHELSFEAGGVPALLAFLLRSFGGGTDVSAPLSRAAARLTSEAWARADVVLVSDGEFPLPDAAAAQIKNALAERGARMHGVLIGSGHSEAFTVLCQPVHTFSSWGAMLGG